jgi:hypothetical protein
LSAILGSKSAAEELTVAAATAEVSTATVEALLAATPVSLLAVSAAKVGVMVGTTVGMAVEV